jgi:hypothetical protein
MFVSECFNNWFKCNLSRDSCQEKFREKGKRERDRYFMLFFALDVLAAVEYLGISVTYLHSIRKTCADFASGLELPTPLRKQLPVARVIAAIHLDARRLCG